jgi:hypothetical protein
MRVLWMRVFAPVADVTTVVPISPEVAMQSLHAVSLPAGIIARCAPDALATVTGLCVRGGRYDGSQVARLFVAAAKLSYDTTITADDVSRAWEEVGIREYQVPRAVGFYGIRQ